MSLVIAIIVAAGKGLRMKTAVPKQFLPIGEEPVVSHTLRVFDRCPDIHRIVLVVPKADVTHCRKTLIPNSNLTKHISIAAGGQKRQDSVYQGLLAIHDTNSIVVIHDGVRPFIRVEHISACIQGAQETGACILGIPAVDTLKRVSKGMITGTIPRDEAWHAQTPQAFRYDIIKAAHDRARANNMTATDDAMLVEWMGRSIRIITGSRRNIKITTPVDLAAGNAFLEMESP